MSLSTDDVTEADIARIRYETAFVALSERARRAEAALAEQAAQHVKSDAELLRQIAELKRTLDEHNKLVDSYNQLKAQLEEKNAALGALYRQLENGGLT